MDARMERVTLGRTDLEVSVIGFGGWPAGGLHQNLGMDIGWSRVSPRQIHRAVNVACDAGINLFDTCSAYGNSEAVLAQALSTVPRRCFVLCSKVGYVRGQHPNAFAPQNIRDQLHQTLAHFGTDHVDILSFHNLYFGEQAQYFDGAMETFLRLKEQGKIRYIGARINHTPTFLAGPDQKIAFAGAEQPLLEKISPDVLQLKFNALMDIESDWVRALRDQVTRSRMGVIVNKPLAQGLLLLKPYPRDGFPVGDHRRRKVEFSPERRRALARRLRPCYEGRSQADLVRLFLSYALSICETAAVLVGTRSHAQAKMNFQFERQSFNADDSELLSRIRACGSLERTE
jgi:aryl-alcohol dehydrogenase-like predicted oxidoreductase